MVMARLQLWTLRTRSCSGSVKSARANGLWGGPLPAELECLTYSERKVIQMARCHVCVKRVFLDARSYKRPSGRAELPKFHEKNVVAYPYHLDLVTRVLGAGPQQLAEAMTVQFVGNDRRLLTREPDLQVSCSRLRDAFCWLAFNCPPGLKRQKMNLSLIVSISEAASKTCCINIIRAQVLQTAQCQQSSCRQPHKFTSNMLRCCSPDQAMLSRQMVILRTHLICAKGTHLTRQDALQQCRVAWTIYHL